MAATTKPLPGRSSAELALTFLPHRRLNMSTTLTTAPSTYDKLLRARDAAALLAQLSTAQKNAILLVMAEALVANEKSILDANRKDMETCGLTGSMRDRLLLNPARIKE